MDPATDDQGIPEINFIKDGSFSNLVRFTKYLNTYRAGWRAVFVNLAVLIVLAAIVWGVCSVAGTDLQKWPWWAYIADLALIAFSLPFFRNFLVYLFDSVRWLPEAIQVKRAKNLLSLEWRTENYLRDQAVWTQITKKIESEVDPKVVDELRKEGFL